MILPWFLFPKIYVSSNNRRRYHIVLSYLPFHINFILFLLIDISIQFLLLIVFIEICCGEIVMYVNYSIVLGHRS